MILLITIGFANAQKNGFYETDSVFFEVTWNIPNNHQVMYSVNQFTESSYKNYIQGFWLYNNRSQEENTWENNLYADEPCYSFDSHLLKGNLNKVNTIRVQLIDTIENKIKKDSIYIIGFGKNPHNHYVLFATIDSSDHAEVFQNYNDDIKKRVWLHILKPDGTFEISQPVEFDIAAGSSACLPNKGVAFKATKDSPINGPNNFKTSIFSKDYKEEIKKIKMRVGGSGQNGSFGINEICLRIIDYPDWKIGGVRNTVGTWYLNGSYWSLGFPQVKPNERYIAEEYSIHKDSVDIIYPIPFNIYFDTMYAGSEDGIRGNFIVFEPATAQMLGYPDIVFFAGNQVIDNLAIIRDPDGRKRVVANAEEGTAIHIQPIFQSLTDLQADTVSDHYHTIDSLIDLGSWLRYLCLIHYFGMTDVISNNVSIGLSYRHKPFILMEDFDGVPSSYNNWDTEIANNDDSYFGIMHEIIQNIILKSPKCRDRMMLVYQDMLNTGLLPSRTVPIVEDMIDELMPEYGYYYQSWGGYPNGGIDSTSQKNMLENFKYFLESRPNISAQLLTDRWQPKDSFNITDKKTITVIFDSIPENSVQLKLNSLNLDSNFIGLYFPKPDLQISYTVSPEYNILIKEYPDSSNNFNLSCDSNLTITFVLREKIVSNISKNIFENKIKISPNPVNDIFTIKNINQEKYSIEIFNTNGVKIFSQKENIFETHIDVSSFVKGMYVVVIRTTHDQLSKKILKF